MTGAARVTEPPVVLVAHGTRHAPGNAVGRALADRLAARSGRRVVAAYVELAAPLLDDVLADAPDGTVVVPLLLSGGFHVRHDLPASSARAPGRVRLTPPLGPDARLARVQGRRLRAAGARPGEPVVLLAAGSSDPAVDDDLARAGALLAQEWGAPVAVATLTGRGTRLADVAEPGVAVSPYLLAEGHFARRARREAQAVGAGPVAPVLGPHPLLVELALARVTAQPALATAGRPSSR